jgi:hypothetical protein
MSCAARAEGDHFVLDGEKTWISNGGIADFYVVFARTGEAPGSRGLSAFIVDADAHRASRSPNASTSSRRIRWRGCASTNCRMPKTALLAAPGQGFKVAMQTLDIFRTSVAAAALGFARHALDERWNARPAADVQPDAGRLPDHPGQAGADGHRHRRRGAAHLPRRLAARPGAERDARSGDGQDDFATEPRSR